MPDHPKNPSFQMAAQLGGAGTPSPATLEKAPAKVAEKIPEASPAETPAEPKVDKAALSKRLGEIKDEGNQAFKTKSYVMAASKFTEGITMFKKNEELCKADADICTKVT